MIEGRTGSGNATPREESSMSDQKPAIVFVTGATAGFGAALARRYIKAGMKVVGTKTC